jgi:hypothetical protein
MPWHNGYATSMAAEIEPSNIISGALSFLKRRGYCPETIAHPHDSITVLAMVISKILRVTTPCHRRCLTGSMVR